MPAPAPRPEPTVTEEPVWLDAAQLATWQGLIKLLTLLPQHLDRQLRQDAGINHTSYQILAILSAHPEGRETMTDLAGMVAISPSRLSHAVAALEERGWVQRVPGPGDKRVLFAQLTAAGIAVLEGAAPRHAGEVRRLVFDPLTWRDVNDLRRIALKILDHLDG